MLDIQHLTRRYQNKLAVSDLSLTFETGKTYALLGPNGSGKTTLMKMIAGLTKQTSGEITLDGIPVGPETKKHIAYMPTEIYFYSYMSIADAGKYYADFFEDFDERRYEEALQRMELNPKDKIRTLSSGMNAKVRLALTLSRDAQVMMFDEPLNGVDILTRKQVVDEIIRNRENGRTMIISTHLVDAECVYRRRHFHEERRLGAHRRPRGAGREAWLADEPVSVDLRRKGGREACGSCSSMSSAAPARRC